MTDPGNSPWGQPADDPSFVVRPLLQPVLEPRRMTTQAACLSPATRRRAPFLATGLAGAALLADVAFDPAHRHVPLCPFHAATGWWCPLCGGLRSAAALAHLALRSALHDNVVFVLALPLIAWWWVAWVRTGRPRRPGRAGVFLLIVVAVAFTVVRNLPVGRAVSPL